MTMRPRGRYLLLVDASSFIHRSFHALPRLSRRSDGLQTGALAGFCKTMMKLFRLNWTPIGSLPSYAAVICDTRGKNFRHDLYPQYKQQRKPYDPELEVQLPWIPTIAKAFNVPCIGMPGWEADDIIATYARLGIESGMEVVIASSDKDLCQLVRADPDGVVLMYDSMKDKGPEDNAAAMISPLEVYRRNGVPPSKIVDFQALTGDVVDNIPGVPGFGPKTAAKLLENFDDVFALIDAAEWEPDKFNPKECEKILAHRDDILMSRRLASLASDVPVDVTVRDLKTTPISSHQLRSLFIDLEFMHLLDLVDRAPRF